MVNLDGRDYLMRPSFQAMVEIEQAAGRGLVPLARDMMAGNFTVSDIAAVIRGGVNTGLPLTTPRLTQAEVGEAVFRAGVLELVPSVVTFLSGCISGGVEPSDEGEAEAVAGPT